MTRLYRWRLLRALSRFRRPAPAPKRRFRPDIARLEDRVVPALASPPQYLFSTPVAPRVVLTPDLNADGRNDLVSLLPDGRVMAAVNGGDGTWGATAITDLGIPAVVGGAVGYFDRDPFPDLVVQTPDGIAVALGDGAGRFGNVRTYALGAPGTFAAPDGATVSPAVGFLTGDPYSDLAVAVPGTNEVLVLKGDGTGKFAAPVHLASGGGEPVAVLVGPFVGDAVPDLAIGHRDGTVTILRGHADGSFSPLAAPVGTGLGTVTGLAAADLDGDGEVDLVVAGTDRVTVLRNRPDPAPQTVLVNGDFSQGLTGWTVDSGLVSGGGAAQFREDATALLSTLRQSFAVPAGTSTLTFDIASYALEAPGGVPPDAFEVSLLDAAGQPLIPGFRADATAFFNLQAGGTTNLAPGVTFDGRRVTVTLSGIPAGTVATLYFDLIGNRPGQTSVSTVDNVAVTPAVRFDDGFEAISLAGPFGNAAGVAVADVDGDGRLDLLLADGDALAVFHGQVNGGWLRDDYALAPDGGAVSVAAGVLTGDGIADAVVAVNGGVRTPLVPSTTVLDAAPRLQPVAAVAGVEGGSTSISATFADGDGGGPYTATVDWGDGTSSAGTVEFANGVGTISAAHVYADNGTYAVRVRVISATGVADFQDSTATVANAAPTVSASDLVVTYRNGPEVAVATFSDPGFTLPDFRTRETFLARIDWGDGKPAPFGRVVLTNGGPGTPTTATVYGTPNYGRPGIYTATVTVADDDGGTRTISFRVVARPAAVEEGVWWVPGNPGETVRVRFDLLGIATSSANELGYFVVDDAEGTVDGFWPSEPAYRWRVLHFAERDVLFPRGSSVDAATWVDLPAGSFVAFYLVQNATTSDLLNAPAPYAWNPAITAWYSPAGANRDDGGQNHFARTDTAGGWVQYGAEDGSDFDFDDLVFRAGPDTAAAPTLGPANALAANEGSPLSLTVPVYSSDANPTATVNWGDGTTSTGTVSVVEGIRSIAASHTYADNGSYTVTATATDSAGRAGSRSFSATVGNVAPTLSPVGSQMVRPGEAFSIPLGNFSDPGFTSATAGTAETFSATVDWGDGSGPQPATVSATPGAVGVPSTGSILGGHSYATPGTYTAIVRVRDDDGGEVVQSFAITAAAGVPTISAASVAAGPEGSALLLTATVSDPDPADALTATVTWGDGASSTVPLVLSGGTATLSTSHTFADDGNYPVSLTVADKYGLFATVPLTAAVSNVAPTATPAAPQSAAPGQPVSLNVASFTDPGFTFAAAGTQETFSASIDWGDGTTSAGMLSVTNGAVGKLTAGTVSGSHIYAAAGGYTVTVSIADDDGGTALVTFPVTVAAGGLICFVPVAPTIAGVSRATSVGSGTATTADTSVALYGTGQPGATLTVSRDGVGAVGTVVVGGDGTWRFDYTGSPLAAGSYSFSASQASFGPLGPAAGYNVFVLNDASGTPDARGRYAVGGNANFSNFSVGQELPASYGSRDSLVVGGSLVTTGGQVYNGNAVYGTTRSVSANTTLQQGAVRKESMIDFAAAGVWLRSQADAWMALPTTGTTSYAPTDVRWAITLSTTATGLVVFTVDGSKLSAASSFTINAPAGATVLVNVTGTSGSMQNFGFFLNGGIDRTKVLFNFANYTSLVLNSVGVAGSVFAPRAAVNFVNGNVDGQLVASSLSGGGVFRNYPFAGQSCAPLGTAAFTVTVAPPPAGPAPKFFVVGAGVSDQYSSNGTLLASHATEGVIGSPVGVAANAAGTWTWIASAAADGTTWIVATDADGSVRGKWRAWGVTDARDVATNGTDVWIVGRDTTSGTLKIFRFAKGAQVLSGGLEALASFALNSGNANPTGLATDGWNVFVTDKNAGGGRIFAYDVNGSLLGNPSYNPWRLDARNADPSGVALNPGGGSELWVVDKTTKQVFTYSNGRNLQWWNSGGPQTASSVFDLAPGSPAPEGIADPDPTPIVLETPVADSLDGPGDAGVFSFSATAGTPLFFDADPGTGSLRWVLTDPNGISILDSNLADSVVVAAIDGEYLLTVTNPSGDPAAYGFRVDALTTTAISTDSDEVGELAPGTPAAAFTFALDDYAAVAFVPSGGDAGFRWSLSGPEGEFASGDWSAGWSVGYYDAPLAPGNYSLSVWASDVALIDPVPYGFRIWNLTDPAATPAMLGDTLVASIPISGGALRYAFEADAGQVLALDALAASGDFELRLYAPNGDELFFHALAGGGSFASRAPYVLPTTGTYVLDVRVPLGDGGELPSGQPGSFELALTEIAVPPATPMVFGAETAGELADGRSVQAFSISATAGDQIRLEAVGGFNPDFRWTLVEPDGTSSFVDVSSDDLSAMVGAGGVYTLYVAAADGSSGGPFAFRASTESTPAIPLALDVPTSGTTPAGGGAAVRYSFTAVPGQRIFFDAALETWPYADGRLAVALTDGSGSPVFSSGSLADVNTTVLAGGDYVLTVSNANGNVAPTAFAFTLWDVPPPEEASIDFDVEVSGATSVPGEVDSFTFAAGAGQRILVEGQTSDLALYDPAGNPVTGFTAGDPFGPGFVLPATGTYRVVFDPGEFPAPRPDVLGSYAFTVWKIDPGTPISIVPGAATEVTTTRAYEEVVLSFAGTVGQRVIVDPFSGPHLRWVRPDGTPFVGNPLSGPVILDRDGTWTLRYIAYDPGTLNVTVRDVPPDETRTGATNSELAAAPAGGQKVAFSLSLTAGVPVVFDVLQNGTAEPTVHYALLAPNGSVVYVPSSGDQLNFLTGDYGPFVPTQTGVYTLVATGWRNDAQQWVGGPFRIRVQEVPTPTPGPLDSRGTEFWLTVPNQFRFDSTAVFQAPLDFSLNIASSVDTSGVVSIPRLGWFSSFVVEAGGIATLALPTSVELSGGLSNAGIHVLAFGPITVTGLSYGPAISDGYLGVPADALGTEYVVLTYGGNAGFPFGSSHASVVATEDDTTVTFIPSVDVAGLSAGIPFAVVLQKGQAYQLGGDPFSPNGDLTGTIVLADKPIATFGGHGITYVPTGTPFANYLVEMIPPTSTWGRAYSVVPFADRPSGALVRVLAQADGTDVELNGTWVATLNRGQFFEATVHDPARVTASAPVLVAQLAFGQDADLPYGLTPEQATGDPTFLIVAPDEQFAPEYVFVSPDKPTFLTHYVNLVVPAAGVGLVTVDGVAVPASSYVAIPGTDQFAVQYTLSGPGTHVLSGPVPFGAVAYGFGPFDAYGFVAGMGLAPVASVAGLSLTPETSAGLAGVAVPFVATVTDASGNPLAGIRVDFAVSGANSANGFAYTDSLGRASFSYVGTAGGSDTVTATSGSFVDSSTVTWSAASTPPTVSIDGPAGTFPVGSTVVVTGLAAAGTPLERIALVTVNGVPVDALDAAGRYFARVTISEGTNSFVVVARDTSGQTASATLLLTGGSLPVAVSGSTDASAAVTVAFANTTFDRRTRTLRADATATNASTGKLANVAAAFVDFDPADVTLHGAPVTAEGLPYLAFGAIAAGATSSAVRANFADPRAVDFGFDLLLLATGNAAPRFDSGPPAEATAGRPVLATLSAVDPDGDALTYSLVSGPEGMLVDAATGAVTWTPTAAQVGVHRIEFAVHDGRGGSATLSTQLTVRALGSNRAPAFTTVPATSVAAGAEFVYLPQAFDADGDAPTFELVEGPAGADFDPATGALRFSEAPGVYSVVLAVVDGNGGRAEQRFLVSVGGVASAAVAIASTPPETVAVGDQYAYLPVVLGASGLPRTFALLTAPAGMSVDANGLVTWVPTPGQVGPHSVVLSVSAGGAVATQSFVVQATAVVANRPPVLGSSPATRIATRGEAFAYDADATDPDGDAVEFALEAAPAGMTIDSATGLLTWTPGVGQSGSYLVTLAASDPFGAVGRQSFFVEVRGPNAAPILTGPSTASATAGQWLDLNFAATDADGDAVRFSLVNAPANARIDPSTGRLVWLTRGGDAGTYAVTVVATDERGLSTELPVVLVVAADTRAPSVVVVTDRDGVNPGETVLVTVIASDDVGVGGRTLNANGIALTLDASGRATYTATQPGVVQFVATATDAAGNVGSATGALRVLDPTDTEAPEVEITSPGEGAAPVSYLTDIVGTVADDNLVEYRVGVSRFGTDQWRQIGYGTVPTAGVLAVFDPTLLDNDTYVIRVTAVDVNQQVTVVERLVETTGQAKIGNFRQEFIDLTVPVAGIPITITRVYDSLQADVSGDFGYGWSLGVGYDPRPREARTVSPFETILGPFVATPFKDGTRVYVTTPDGRRVGFTFEAKPYEGVASPLLEGAPIPGGMYMPYFRPDPGVYETLRGEFDGSTYLPLPLQKIGDQYYMVGISVAYNPNSYVLTTKDGLSYTFDQFEGMRSISDRNGVTLTFTRDGIFSSLGPAVTFARDASGRITTVTDPAGNAISYDYDANGDLVEVTNRVGMTMSYDYLAAPMHFLAGVTDALGHIDIASRYDADGRVSETADALGNATLYGYDLVGFRETVTDPLGKVATFEHDARGNVVSVTNPLGRTVRNEFDSSDNRIRVTDPAGNVTATAYDTSGNPVLITDPLGHTWGTEFNALNLPVRMTDPLGRIKTFEYDPNGNLVRTVEPDGSVSLAFFDSDTGIPLAVIDRTGAYTVYEYSGGFMAPTALYQSDGTVIRTTFDELGNVTSVTNERGDRTLFSYDAEGRDTEVVSADGLGVRYVYEGDRIIKTQAFASNPPEAFAFARFAAESAIPPAEPVLREINYAYDDDDMLSAIIDVLGRETSYGYDAARRQTSATDSRGGTTRTEYYDDGTVKSVTDALGNTTTYEYDAAGNLIAEVDALGRRKAYLYDALGRLVGKDDCPCPDETYEYDAVGNLLRLTDKSGNSTTFGYDLQNRLVARTDAAGGVTRWEYDAENRRTAETDPLGRTTRWDYDTRGRVVRQLDAAGGTTEYGYDGVGNRTSVTDPLGRSTSTVYDSSGRPLEVSDPLGRKSYREYDLFGNVLSTIDPFGAVTLSTYDADDRPIEVVDALGGLTAYAYDDDENRVTQTDPLGRVSTTVFDLLGRPIESIDALGGISRTSYDAVGNVSTRTDVMGRTTSYTYDTLNRLKTVTDAAGGVTTYGYSSVGNLTHVTDARGFDTFTAYDALNRPVTVTDAAGGQTEYEYDAVGNRTAITDARGFTTRFDYDDLNRAVRTTDPLGGVRTTEYDAAGQVSASTDALGRTTRMVYDPLGRLSEIINARGETTTLEFDDATYSEAVRDPLGRTTTKYFDLLGRQILVVDPTGAERQMAYDAVGNLVASSDPMGRTTSYVYDDLNRLISSTDPTGATALSVYDASGNVTSEIDPNGRITISAYDALDRLVSVTDPAGGVTEYAYDANGNRTAVRDGSGNVTTFDFDGMNRVSKMTDPLGRSATYAYDANGNRVEVVDRNGRRTTFSFDALNRKIGELWWGDSGTTYSADYAFDLGGNLVSAGDTFSRYTMSYDELDRVVAVDNMGTSAVPRVILTYAYDAGGQLVQTADNAGVTVASAYDAAGRLASRVWTGGPEARVDYSRDLAGWLTGIDRWNNAAGLGDKVSTTIGHDDRGEILGLRHLRPDTSPITERSYAYDASGQLTFQSVDGTNTTFDYDDRGQLTAAEGADTGDEAFEYDATGNRTGNSGAVGVGNRLTEDANFTYEYDANGSRTLRTDKSTGEYTAYEYDHRNRLIGVDRYSAGGILLDSSDYVYDVMDRLIVRSTNGVNRSTVYDGSHVWADYAADGQVETRYLFGSEVDELAARWRPSEGVRWYLTDRQGSVVVLAAGDGTVVNQIDYTAFGSAAQSNPSAGDRFLYTGREWDAGVGLYWYRARWYDPASGRFVSEDPLGFLAGDVNLSRYVGNQPTGYTDPSGMLARPPRTMMSNRVGNAEYSLTTRAISGVLAAAGRQYQNVRQIVTGIGGGTAGAEFSGFALSLTARLSNTFALTSAVVAVQMPYLPLYWEKLQVSADSVQELMYEVELSVRTRTQTRTETDTDTRLRPRPEPWPEPRPRPVRPRPPGPDEPERERDECRLKYGLLPGSPPDYRYLKPKPEATPLENLPNAFQRAQQLQLLERYNNGSRILTVPKDVYFRIEGGQLPRGGSKDTAGLPRDYTQYVAGESLRTGPGDGGEGVMGPDVAGHVIHYDLGGGVGVGLQDGGRPVNIVPMTNTANRFRYYSFFEREALAQVQRGNTICVAIHFIYGDPNYPARPRSWTVHMMVRDRITGKWETNYLNREFTNDTESPK